MLTQSLLIIMGLALVLVLSVPSSRKRAISLCKTAFSSQSKEKQEKKDKILALLEERGELSNLDIQKETGLHRRSIRRYMDELEISGDVEQIGDIGKSVTYRLNKNPK
ncbi:MAG: winged helix-turn-helix transcriptional regulator [Candidatus Spechtbacterales bacterium]|nr:winged helix-turn-helix transcriptional regulator [Candidatus Spechtbacterales bacterium]